jgi:proteasome regulatory subunit
MSILAKKQSGDSSYFLDEENKKLREVVSGLKRELNKYKEPPLVVCDVMKVFAEKAIIRLQNGNRFFVNISPSLVGKVFLGQRVLVEQKSLVIVELLERARQFDVENFVIVEKPKISWKEIGGLSDQIREIHEVVELPLKNPKLFRKVGIQPPKGVLLYGPSGTGKTILAKAVAKSTNSTFIEIVGSELVQKFIGEGAKLVKNIFSLAKEKKSAIIFIDEIDAIASERVDIGTSGEREVQRTFMQLLSEIDGFDPLDNVKIIGATNRIDILDESILRPGRLDRLIHIPLPVSEARREIFNIHSRNMHLNSGVDVSNIVSKTQGFSGAEVKAVCTEAGYFAIRDRRTKILMTDFLQAIDKIKKEELDKEHLGMFG